MPSNFQRNHLAKLQFRLDAYARLIRLNKPVGMLLLMWPMLMALWVAGSGHPDPKIVGIFLLGCFVMRSAGCAINDFADRHFDAFVKRTKDRPLALKQISPIEALSVYFILISVAFLLVLCTNIQTLFLAIVGLILATFYPFLKRFTHFPQFFLGMSFAWAIPMSYCALLGRVPAAAWLLVLATLTWAVAYDTQYALVDSQYDKKLGLKSTALLFGKAANAIVLILQLISCVLWGLYGFYSGLFGGWLILGLNFSILFIVYQYYLLIGQIPERCFKAFLNNQWLGAVWFLSILFELLV